MGIYACFSALSFFEGYCFLWIICEKFSNHIKILNFSVIILSYATSQIQLVILCASLIIFSILLLNGIIFNITKQSCLSIFMSFKMTKCMSFKILTNVK